mmetsp:Transcript_38303/g.44626  ORF Transcript_38303/g.44626 Transcript_38303/m.44626 type:complete len:85 (-) Transcript_38303:252-506(-)
MAERAAARQTRVEKMCFSMASDPSHYESIYAGGSHNYSPDELDFHQPLRIKWCGAKYTGILALGSQLFSIRRKEYLNNDVTMIE